MLFSKRVVTNFSDIVDESLPTQRGTSTYMIVQCKGCDEVSFLLRLSGEVYRDEKGDEDYIDLNFPDDRPRAKSDSAYLSFQEQDCLPRQLAVLYEQLESAFLNEANILAGIGLRILIEAVCKEQNIPGPNLKAKIQQLHTNGLISKNEVPILDKLREIGTNSAHGIKGFSITKLKYALDIVNHILKSIYVLPRINKKLKL